MDKIEADEGKGTLTVTGDADPYEIIVRIRKAGKHAEVVSVGPPQAPQKKDEKKPEEKKKPEAEKKDEKPKESSIHMPYYYPPYQSILHYIVICDHVHQCSRVLICEKLVISSLDLFSSYR